MASMATCRRPWALVITCLGMAALAFQACAPGEAPPPAAAPAAGPKPPEQILQTVVSPRGKRQAHLIKRQEKFLVRLEGEEAGEFEEIANVRFTPDGQSLLFEGRRGQTWFVVVDGREWALDAQVVHGSLRLSPDRQRLALLGLSRGKWQAMVDGRPQEPYDYIFGDTLAFSADSLRVGYLAVKNGKLVAVVDGSIIREFPVPQEARQALNAGLNAAATPKRKGN